jgi:small nuclear ribonucleoprotein (snRNP)-like protein
VRLAPHYSGLSEGTIKQLDEHLKVVITCVINDLKGEKEKHSLTFSTIRSRLMQLTVLEALPNTTALSKVIKCNNEHPFTAQVLLDSQVCSDDVFFFLQDKVLSSLRSGSSSCSNPTNSAASTTLTHRGRASTQRNGRKDLS